MAGEDGNQPTQDQEHEHESPIRATSIDQHCEKGGGMLIVSSRNNPSKAGQSDAAFWADLINAADGENAILIEPRADFVADSESKTEASGHQPPPVLVVNIIIFRAQHAEA